MAQRVNRRQLLHLAAGGAAATMGAALFGSAVASGASKADRLAELTATEALDLLRKGTLKASHYVDVLVERAQGLQPLLNPFISFDAKAIRAAARAADKEPKRHHRKRSVAALHGLPIMVKDNINTAGVVTTAGTPALSANLPNHNAVIVDRLLDAGALVFGKTNMHELAAGITSNNPFRGPVSNPYDRTKIPGGSSGGNAAALAARIAPAAIGTDTSGSIRIPAALCGVAGFRPTVGRYPQTGDIRLVTDVVPLSHTRDTTGVMARCVADTALLDAVITGDDPVSPAPRNGLRLGVLDNFLLDLDPEVQRVVTAALGRLQAAGIELVSVSIPDLSVLNDAISFPIVLFEAPRALTVYLDANKPNYPGNNLVTLQTLVTNIVSPDVMALFSQSASIPNLDVLYTNALTIYRPLLQAAYNAVFDGVNVDALVFPTTPLPARPIGEDFTVELNGRQVSTLLTYTRHTDPGANAGLPGLTMPAGLTVDGLPVGIELEGRFNGDRRLMSIGLAVEEVLGTVSPPIP